LLAPIRKTDFFQKYFKIHVFIVAYAAGLRTGTMWECDFEEKKLALEECGTGDHPKSTS